jgi:hypothetical protein
MISLKQQGLLIPSVKNDKDGNGRINGRVVKEDSEFVRTLVARLFDSSSGPMGKDAALQLWCDLKILEIIGVHSIALDKATSTLLFQALQDQGVPTPGLIGVLLAVKNDREWSDDSSELLRLISSQIKGLTSDVEFLGGLEIFLSQLSRYFPT